MVNSLFVFLSRVFFLFYTFLIIVVSLIALGVIYFNFCVF